MMTRTAMAPIQPLTRAEQHALNFLGDDEHIVSGPAGEKIRGWFEKTGRQYFLRGCDSQVFVERAAALEAIVVEWIRQEWMFETDPDPELRDFPNLAAAFKESPEIQFLTDGLEGLMKRLVVAGRILKSPAKGA